MPFTLAEKIIRAHAIGDEFGSLPIEKERDVAIKIDQTLTQDATGTMAYLQFETIGIPRVKTELSVSYIDHNTLQSDFKNMDDHLYLESAAKKFGVYFSRPGNGICHQVHLEHFGKPGKTLLGSDSHTPTGGALGMLAIGAGGLDVAVAMGGGAFHLAMPKIIGVQLTGKLKKGVGAKDVILEILRRETVKGGVLSIYEYFGKGVSSLTVPQRAVITNMGAELGATTSIFPSDEKTKAFLTALGRAKDWSKREADLGCEYDKIIQIDLGKIVPMAACPHSPDAVKPIEELEGKRVNQVVIGSCTNSSIDDLESVAAIVKNKHIAAGVEAGIAPGSRAVLLMAAKSGILETLIQAGFRILECACGPCIGMGFAPNSKGVSLRTFNRNFKGRSGTADAEVFLVSPETAAASSITGVITSAKNFSYKDAFFTKQGRVSMLTGENENLSALDIKKIGKDSAMIIAPLSEEEARGIKIVRGPNIKPCPASPACSNTIAAVLALKTGDNVSTDDIMPAGTKVLPFRSNIPEMSKFAFSRIDKTFYDRAEKRKFAPCVVAGGENYGQGSSREHAALAPMYLGVRAVIAKSFARIHKANLVNFGIIPMEFEDARDYDFLREDDEIIIETVFDSLENGKPFSLSVRGKKILCKNDLSERSRKILRAGGLAAYTRKGGK